MGSRSTQSQCRMFKECHEAVDLLSRFRDGLWDSRRHRHLKAPYKMRDILMRLKNIRDIHAMHVVERM